MKRLPQTVRVVDDGEWRVDEPRPRCWSGEPHAFVVDFWDNAECAYCHVKQSTEPRDTSRRREA